MSKKLLIIPHSFNRKVKVRELELAKNLTRFFEVYYITGSYVENAGSIYGKLVLFFKSLFKKKRIFTKNNIKFIEIPILYFPKSLRKQSLTFNKRILSRLLNELKIDVVINSSFEWFPLEKKKDVIYIYDLVDDVLDEELQKTFILNEMKKSNLIITISEHLRRKIKRILNEDKKVCLIPNGSDIKKLREVNEEEILKIKQKYLIPKEKTVIGFIGYFEKWTGLDFLYKVFNNWNQNDFLLLLVGDGPAVDVKFHNKNVLHVGFQHPSKIHRFFQLIDIGVLPFRRSSFTDNSFPIKIVEYGASRKLVIANKLNILKELNLPNVHLMNLNVNMWRAKIKELRHKKFCKKWDEIYDKYDWQILSKKLYDVINGEIKG